MKVRYKKSAWHIKLHHCKHNIRRQIVIKKNLRNHTQQQIAINSSNLTFHTTTMMKALNTRVSRAMTIAKAEPSRRSSVPPPPPPNSQSPVNAQQYMSRVGKAHVEFKTTLAQKKRMAEQQHVQNLRAFTKSLSDCVEDMKKMEVAFASALLDAIVPETPASSTPASSAASEEVDKKSA